MDYTEQLNSISSKLDSIIAYLQNINNISYATLQYFLFFACAGVACYLCYLFVKPLWLSCFKY